MDACCGCCSVSYIRCVPVSHVLATNCYRRVCTYASLFMQPTNLQPQLWALGSSRGSSGSTAMPQPTNADIKLRVFILSSSVATKVAALEALSLGCALPCFAGDGRDFSYNNGSSRAELHVTLRMLASDGRPLGRPELIFNSRSFGESHQLDINHVSHVAGKPDWFYQVAGPGPIGQPRRSAQLPVSSDQLDATLAVIGPRDVLVTLLVKAANPLLLLPAALAPAIDAQLLIQFDFAAGTYSITGQHDGFPAYELYINMVPVHRHDPVAAGKGPADLIGKMGVTVNVLSTPLPAALWQP